MQKRATAIDVDMYSSHWKYIGVNAANSGTNAQTMCLGVDRQGICIQSSS